MARWQWLLRLLTRRIWFRAALFSLLAVFFALLAAWIAPFIPYEISATIGSEAVDDILGIMASSLLAVTTFSLTAMVSAFSAASTAITPRATELLVQDPTAQNALSTFLGGFLFSIVGICALSTGLYGESGRVILFAGTILMIVIIAITLLRWIEHLSRFGRVADSIRRVEHVACKAATKWGYPVRLADLPVDTPPEAHAIPAAGIGYITHIDVPALGRLAEEAGLSIEVAKMPGSFVTPSMVLARLDGHLDDEKSAETVVEAFTLQHDRAFDQDPRFGLVVLSEIASRALSPAVNDPGTAISVLGAGLRVLQTILAESRRSEPQSGPVRLPGLVLDDLLDDFFEPIARDGAGVVEVQIRLQRSLAQLAALVPEAAPRIEARAQRLLDRAMDVLEGANDRARLDAARGRTD